MNGQPWHFVVVQDAATRRKIADGARAAWVGFARDLSKDKQAPGFQAVDRWAMGGLAEAPVIIVLCGDTERRPLEQMGSSSFPAAQNVLLAANALGLGSLMSNLPLFAPDGALAKTLELPEHIVPLATLPIGYADGVPVAASNRGWVWLAGERRPIAGRVSMDSITIDVGDADVEVGDEAVLFGNSDPERVDDGISAAAPGGA